MDALKFVRETNRMCKSFVDSCEDCPANDVSGCMVDQLYEEIVPIVEKWAKENPRNTRQDVFLEQWPETTPDEHGVMRWIPVTERLPEAKEGNLSGIAMVLVTVQPYCFLTDEPATPYATSAVYDIEQRIFDVGGLGAVNAVLFESDKPRLTITHWMPYPKLPKEENDG